MSFVPHSSPLGTHLLIELYGCNVNLLNDADAIEAAMVEAAKEGGATVVQTVFHRFSLQGISGVVVIAESHLTVHTWPEYGYAALDVFTCGNREMPRVIAQALNTSFHASRCELSQHDRGFIPHKLETDDLPMEPQTMG